MMSIVLGSFLILGSSVSLAATADTMTKKAELTLSESTNPNKLAITDSSDLNFGSKEIGLTDMLFTSQDAATIQVTDIRGDAPGWNLSLSLGEFTTSGSGTALTLKGVKLFYPAATMTTSAGAVNADNRVPTTLEPDSAFSSSDTKGVIIESSSTPSSKVLFNATEAHGNGQWTANYTAGQIELNVPSGNLAGDYSADLVYTLADTPTT